MNTIDVETKIDPEEQNVCTSVPGTIADSISGTATAYSQDAVIIKGSTWAAIWHMSWPLFLNMVTIAIASFADLWVAGQLGSNAQAAIGMGGQIWFFMVLLAVALSA